MILDGALIVSQELEEQKISNGNLREQLEKAKNESVEKGSVSLVVSPCHTLSLSFPTNATVLRLFLANSAQEQLQEELEHLRRENKLIMSAWYDMTTRLQSNTVILQRKSEAPRSWLGKQRTAVGGNGSLVSFVRPSRPQPPSKQNESPNS